MVLISTETLTSNGTTRFRLRITNRAVLITWVNIERCVNFFTESSDCSISLLLQIWTKFWFCSLFFRFPEFSLESLWLIPLQPVYLLFFLRQVLVQLQNQRLWQYRILPKTLVPKYKCGFHTTGPAHITLFYHPSPGHVMSFLKTRTIS